MCIMSIIFMTINYFNYFQLFHSNWNNWYNSTTSPCPTSRRTVPSTLFAFITYRETIPMPKRLQTTSCIRLRNPAGGRRALLESDCTGGGEWFRCRRLELPAVFPGYFQLEWRRELVFCSLARIGHGNRQIPANLKCFNQYNHTIMGIIYEIDVSDIINIITILRIVRSSSYVSSVDTSAHSRDLDPVSVAADAENSSKTRAYQTVSGDTTKAPLSTPGGLIMTMSMRWLPWNIFAGNGLQ